MENVFVTITNILFSHSDHEAQPWGGPKADKNGGAGAEPPLTFILINSRLTVRRPLGSLTLADINGIHGDPFPAGVLPPHPRFCQPKGLRNVGLWASPGLRLMIAVGKYYEIMN